MFQNINKSPEQLTEGEAGLEIKRLSDLLKYHNEQYFQKNSPAITDSEYDKLFQRQLKIESLFPQLIKADSPTQAISPIVSKFNKIDILWM